MQSVMHFSTPKPSERLSRADDPVIFDMNRPDHYELVRRIYLGRFTERVRAAGIELDDGFQNVVEGILRKSRSERSRWNPKRGSISTWVYVAISGLVINMVASAARLGRSSPDADADVASWAVDERTGSWSDDESDEGADVVTPSPAQPVVDAEPVRVSASVIRIRKAQREEAQPNTYRSRLRRRRAEQLCLFARR